MKNKTTKKVLLFSVLSMVLCIAMFVGSTFAWFTDTVTSGTNTIVAGNLNVELYHTNAYVTTETQVDKNTKLFLNKEGKDGEHGFQWEPGAMLYENFTVENVGTLALKYTLTLNAECNTVDGKSLADVLKVAVLDKTFSGERADALNANFDKTVAEFVESGAVVSTGALNTKGDESTCAIIIYWQQTKDDNDYIVNNDEALYIELGVNLEAKQAAYESDSFGSDYDENARYPDTAEYTLAEFNELSAIPENIKTVYVDLTGASLQGGLTIGNSDIADHYNYGNWNSNVVPTGYPYDTGRTNTKSTDGAVRKLYSTGKNGINLILTGTILGAEDTGTFNAGKISLKVPDASTVTFEKVTFGAGQMSLDCWQEAFQSTNAKHCVKRIVFNACTFQGNWLQNGSIDTADMLFKDCTFEYYENKVSYNNSNPIWIQNMGQCNVTIEGCTFNACRPIKLWENTVSGTVTIKNNTFNMQISSQDSNDTYKNDAILFSTINGPLGDVVVSGNTVNGGTAFLTFFNPEKITMAEGATFTVTDNILNGGAKTSVEWKTATDFIPSFVIVK